MKIILGTEQIDQAIRDHVSNMGLSTQGMNIEISLTTVRKPTPGYSAEITISRKRDSIPAEATEEYAPLKQSATEDTSEVTQKEEQPPFESDQKSEVEEEAPKEESAKGGSLFN
tara:strand:- start:48064 stop:48405 length:342 start_codon:yes stop_codon:yes gene_type:complete